MPLTRRGAVPDAGVRARQRVGLVAVGSFWRLVSSHWWPMMVVAIAALQAGCAATRAGDRDVLTAEEREITLEIQNQNFYDATVYAISTGARLRLGMVGGHREETFRFRWHALDLRVEIRLGAVGTYFSEQLPVEEGDYVYVVIDPDLDREAPVHTR